MRIYISCFHQEYDGQLMELIHNAPEGVDLNEIVKMEIVKDLYNSDTLVSGIIRNDHTYEGLSRHTNVTLNLVKNINGQEMYTMTAVVGTSNWGPLHCVGLVNVYH